MNYQVEWLMFSLAILLLFIAVSDIKFRKIPNSLCAIVATICIFLLVDDRQWENIAHPIGIILLGVILSHFRLLGGGDSKLFAAYSFAIPSNYLLTTVLMIALIGGVISVFYIARTRLFKKPARGIPYGIAISLGCSISILASTGTL